MPLPGQRGRQVAVASRVGDDREPRAEAARLLGQQFDAGGRRPARAPGSGPGRRQSRSSVWVPTLPVLPRHGAPCGGAVSCHSGHAHPRLARRGRITSPARPPPGAAAISPSRRSSRPPWPGISRPESFTPKPPLDRTLHQIARLRRDRPARAAADRPASAPAIASPRPRARRRRLAATRPPAAPDHVLAGRDRRREARAAEHAAGRERADVAGPHRHEQEQGVRRPGRGPAPATRRARRRPAGSAARRPETSPTEARAPRSRRPAPFDETAGGDQGDHGEPQGAAFPQADQHRRDHHEARRRRAAAAPARATTGPAKSPALTSRTGWPCPGHGAVQPGRAPNLRCRPA